jgi:uncharacterized protein (DUF1330 family)
MSAYLIVYIEAVTDPARLAEYRRIAGPTLQQHGAQLRVRNGKFEALEGAAPQAVIMLEFPSMQAAKTWYESPQYQEALEHRHAGARCRAILVEGV